MHIVKNPEWAAFCQKVTQQLAGAVVQLEAFEPDGIKTEPVDGAELQSMELKKTDACNDSIVLHFRNAPDYEIVGPVDISLRESGTPKDFNLIQIQGENGTVMITSHPAIHPQMLEELKTT